MPFKRTPQKFNASIRTVEIGAGDNKITIGGQNTLPFYVFDSPMGNPPKIGVEVLDTGLAGFTKGLAEYYGNFQDIAQIAEKAGKTEGADFICLRFEGADPNGLDRSVEDCVQIAKTVAEATDLPLVIAGSKNVEKDGALFNAVSEALEGRNVLIMSAREENYKTVGASAGLAYKQKVGAESSVDINLAKQLNVLLTQLGVNPDSIVQNLGSAAAGYGFEYVASTMDRVMLAALQQNDAMIQMPVITPVSSETWSVKESVVSESDMPEWGDQEERAVNMEIVTAAACLASGSNAVILRHPQSIVTISKLIKELI